MYPFGRPVASRHNFPKVDVYAPDGSPLYSVSAQLPNTRLQIFRTRLRRCLAKKSRFQNNGA